VLIVVAIVLIVPCGLTVVGALLLPAVARATRNAKVTGCQNNLSQLWRLQASYAARFGGPQKKMPTERGEKFWLKLSQSDPPLVDQARADLFQCPLEPSGGWETCDYRGPRADVNQRGYSDTYPVGADKEGNHGNGEVLSILLKSGQVKSVLPNEPLRQEAEKWTCP